MGHQKTLLLGDHQNHPNPSAPGKISIKMTGVGDIRGRTMVAKEGAIAGVAQTPVLMHHLRVGGHRMPGPNPNRALLSSPGSPVLRPTCTRTTPMHHRAGCHRGSQARGRDPRRVLFRDLSKGQPSHTEQGPNKAPLRDISNKIF